MSYEIEHYPQGYQILKDGFDAHDKEVLKILNMHDTLIAYVKDLYAGFSPSSEEDATFDSEVWEFLYGKDE